MKLFECKCGSKDVFIDQVGSNCGLYCSDCGKCITWLNKDEKRLAERQIQGNEKKIRDKAIDDFAKWLENKKYLMKEIQEHDFCYTHYDELKANYVKTEYFEEQLKGEEV